MARTRLEKIAAFFRPASSIPAARRAALLVDNRRFHSAQTLVAAFYAVMFFFAASNLYSWQELLSSTELAPRWPVFWLRFVELRAGIAAILWLNLVGGLLGIALPGYRWVRILVCLSWLELLALRFSFGSINHGDHLGVLLSFVLIFLPAGWPSQLAAERGVRARTQLVFSGCQAMIMLTYSMSGMWKVGGVVEQLIRGEVNYLAPRGLAQQVAARLLAENTTSILGPWLIEHYWLGWPLMIGALYLEFFALWAVPRPSLHRAWGLGLIVLHVFSHLTMGISFLQNMLWLALFFVFSPLRPEKTCWREMARDLPALGRWLKV
ncbi:MAG: hypothetical protein HC897_12805 [Thermoanaerobaculia bacterium]|nr:hypothetical protein [Thermoanaerobaculia bacterium]